MMRGLLFAFVVLMLTACASQPENGTNPDRAAAELYQDARAAWQRGDYQGAVDQLESLEARYPFGVYAEQAQLDIIYAYYKMDETASAVAAADRFVRLNPRHPRVDYAWYMQGVAQQETSSGFLSETLDLDRAARDPKPLRQGFDALRTLLERYPESEYAADARERMRKIRDQLARHELRIARFYAERNAWVAVSNRANRIVREFPGTPAMAPALQLLERAYGALEIGDLRRDVERVLEANGLSASGA